MIKKKESILKKCLYEGKDEDFKSIAEILESSSRKRLLNPVHQQ